jgi:AAA+ ATPase superfamily predicted ATPase
MKPLKPKTGSPAEGAEYFFKRKKLIDKIFEKIENKENILISAPRRIGKSSILKYIMSNPKSNQIIKYMIVQSAENSDVFYKKVLNSLITDREIFNLTESYLKQFSISLKAYISKVKGIKFDGVDISDNDNLNYYDIVSKLFTKLSQHNKQIILIFDEFPDAVANIYNDNHKRAVTFLQQHREFRELYSNSSLLFISLL